MAVFDRLRIALVASALITLLCAYGEAVPNPKSSSLKNPNLGLKPKRIGGPPDEFRGPESRPKPKKAQSKHSARIVPEGGGEITMSPGGQIEIVAVIPTKDIDFFTVVKRTNDARFSPDTQQQIESLQTGKDKNAKLFVVKDPSVSKATVEVLTRGTKRGKKNDDHADVSDIDSGIYVISRGSSDVVLEASFLENDSLVGSTLTLSGCVNSGSTGKGFSTSEITTVTATASLLADDKIETVGSPVPLEDASLDGNGCFTFTHAPTDAGLWAYSVNAEGVDGDGETFERSLQLLQPIEEPIASVESASMEDQDEDGEPYVLITINGGGSDDYTAFLGEGIDVLAYAELLGTNIGGGGMKAVAYAQHLTTLSPNDSGGWTAMLMLHKDWLRREEAFLVSSVLSSGVQVPQ